MLKTDYFRIFRRHIGFFCCRALLCGIADVFAGMAVHVNIMLLFGIAKKILTRSADVTTSAFPAAILDFLGVERCRVMSDDVADMST